jgi:hypothetical protein
VVAGTATAVSNRVSRRQANKWSQQSEPQPQPQPQYYEAPPQYAPPPAPAPAPAPAAAAAPDPIEKLKQLAELRDQGILTEEEFTTAKAKVLAG